MRHTFQVFSPKNNAWIVNEIFDDVVLDYEIEGLSSYDCTRGETTFHYDIPAGMLIVHIKE